MRYVSWGIGVALTLGATAAKAGQPVDRDNVDAVDEGLDAASMGGEEQIGEVGEAATSAGTACRVGCATSYAALCIRVRNICAIGTVVTLGETAIPCATAVAAVCLTSTAVAVICADRCPP
jgi:hypothetical protein